MATTFIVEDGTGLTTANSYLSEADADQYHENYDNPIAWSGASSTTKQNALRVATRYLDQTFVARWRGVRGSKLQALDWPRARVVDISGWALDEDSLPRELEDATAQAALEVINGDILLPNITVGNTGITREKKKVDVLEKDITYAGTKNPFKVYSRVEATLRPLLIVRKRLVRS